MRVPDEELMTRLARDPAALAEFYDRHFDRVLTFAARRTREPEAAADLVADVFLALVEGGAERYDPHRGAALPYVLGIAAKLFASRHRRFHAEEGAAARWAARPPLDADDVAAIEARIDAEREARQAHRAVGSLPPGERALFELVALEGLTPSEAARALGLTAATARMRLTRARRKVRGLLTPAEPSPPATSQEVRT